MNQSEIEQYAQKLCSVSKKTIRISDAVALITAIDAEADGEVLRHLLDFMLESVERTGRMDLPTDEEIMKMISSSVGEEG